MRILPIFFALACTADKGEPAQGADSTPTVPTSLTTSSGSTSSGTPGGTTTDTGPCTDPQMTWATGTAPPLAEIGDAPGCDQYTTSDWTFDTNAWTRPRGPSFGQLGGLLHFAVIADRWETNDDAGMALSFPLAVEPTTLPSATSIWQGAATPLPLGDAVDAVSTGTYLGLSTTYQFPGISGYLSIRGHEYLGTANALISTSTEWGIVDTEYVASAVDVELDGNDHPWSISCGDGVVQVVRGDWDSISNGDDLAQTGGLDAGVCFWLEQPGSTSPSLADFALCTSSGCEAMTYDSAADTLSPAAVNPLSGTVLDFGRRDDGIAVLSETGNTGASVEGDSWGPEALFDLLPVQRADVDSVTNGATTTVYAVALVDDPAGAQIWVTFGEPGGSWVLFQQPFSVPNQPDAQPTGVAIHATPSHLVLGVTADTPDPATDDLVGWTSYAL